MKIEITKEEAQSGITQLGTRLDDLNELIVVAGTKKDIKRIKEIMEFMKPIESLRTKLYEVN